MPAVLFIELVFYFDLHVMLQSLPRLLLAKRLHLLASLTIVIMYIFQDVMQFFLGLRPCVDYTLLKLFLLLGKFVPRQVIFYLSTFNWFCDSKLYFYMLWLGIRGVLGLNSFSSVLQYVF